MDQTDNCIDYIEFEVTDIERAKRFYGAVFGWTFTDYGPEYCEFNDGRIARPVFQFPGGERFEFFDPDGHKLAVWRET